MFVDKVKNVLNSYGYEDSLEVYDNIDLLSVNQIKALVRECIDDQALQDDSSELLSNVYDFFTLQEEEC